MHISLAIGGSNRQTFLSGKIGRPPNQFSLGPMGQMHGFIKLAQCHPQGLYLVLLKPPIMQFAIMARLHMAAVTIYRDDKWYIARHVLITYRVVKKYFVAIFVQLGHAVFVCL